MQLICGKAFSHLHFIHQDDTSRGSVVMEVMKDAPVKLFSPCLVGWGEAISSLESQEREQLITGGELTGPAREKVEQRGLSQQNTRHQLAFCAGQLPGGKGATDPFTVSCASSRIWNLIQAAMGSWMHTRTLVGACLCVSLCLRILSQQTHPIAYERLTALFPL